MAHKSDQERIEQTRNVPRFFVEHPQVSWVLLLGVLIWGWFGYKSMPQRKDPNIPVRVALASCSWPGATAQQVEQLITRPIEDTAAQNQWIHAGTPADFGVRSISLPGHAYVYIQLVDNVDDLKRQFSDINLKLNALNSQLPQGAGPITFQSDFGDTAALMLTVASPKADSVEINLRSQSIQEAIRSARAIKKTAPPAKPVTIIYPFPESVSPRAVAGGAALFERKAIQAGVLGNTTQIQGTGFIGLDGTSNRDDASIQAFIAAAWLGPTKLATAIFFATITNIIAYLPFLMLTGNTGQFLRSLPIVMTASLVCALVVAMTFIPLLGYYIQRPPRKKELSIEEKRERGFYGFYNRLVGRAIAHRWSVLLGSLVFLVIGGFVATHLKQQFFPEDVQYWFYLDVWLPNDVPLTATNDVALKAEDVVRRVLADAGEPSPQDKNQHNLTSITSFIGGGGPRFWFSISPEPTQTNYAQVIVQVNDKELTPKIIGPLQSALTRQVPGAWITVRQLQTNPVETPVEILISGQADTDAKDETTDIQTLRGIAAQVMDVLRQSPGIAVMRDDWSPDSPQVKMQIDSDRANVAGITNADVANSTAAAISGAQVGLLKEGNKSIPIVARLRGQERAQLGQIENLYVYSSQQSTRVPLLSVATVRNILETGRIRRREHFRTVSVLCFPAPGVLASEVLGPAQSKLDDLKRNLPPGYQLEIGGEQAKQVDGFLNLAVVLLISLVGIYLALLIQFNNAVKPLLVFAAAPYGAIGALIALAIMHTPFGFMAFLGVASLIGVIVSHVIVLFDFIEEMHEKGEPLERALPDAGIERIRPVMITVGATILALFPLALEGGPLWKPLCYAQIGGLAVATFITLLLVPVFYSIFVLDLKWIKWETTENRKETAEAESLTKADDGPLPARNAP